MSEAYILQAWVPGGGKTAVLGRPPVPGNTVPVGEPQVPLRTPRIVLIRGSGAILNTNLSTFLPSWMSRISSSPERSGGIEESGAFVWMYRLGPGPTVGRLAAGA